MKRVAMELKKSNEYFIEKNYATISEMICNRVHFDNIRKLYRKLFKFAYKS